MNRLSRLVRKTSLVLSVGLISISLVTPTLTYAESSKSDKHSAAVVKKEKERSFCSNLPGDVDKLNANFTTIKNRINSARLQQDEKSKLAAVVASDRVSGSRIKWDKQRQLNFTTLEAKATSPALKSAVTTYENAIISAVNSRRSANDSVRVNYQTEVKNVATKQRAAVDVQLATFMDSVTKAEHDAKINCQSHPEKAPDHRTAFVAAVKSAHDNYVHANKTDGTSATQISQLKTAREASFKANEATYEATSKAARSVLETAFKAAKI